MQPNPTHVEYTNIVVKSFYTTIGQYPTLYDFLTITPKDIFCWEYDLAYPKCAKPKIFQRTVLPTPLYEWTTSVDPPKSLEVLHHMCDSGESPDVSICHTTSTMTSLPVCQLHDLSVCQPNHDSTWKSFHLSVCQSSIPYQLYSQYCITGPNFLKVPILGKFVSVCSSSDSSIDPSGSLSSTPSLSAENH